MTFTDDTLSVSKVVVVSNRETENPLTLLSPILNGLDAIFMITVSETGEILFINDRKKELFGVGHDVRGQLCYSVLHDRNERCDFCACHQFAEDPDKILQWDMRHPATGQTYRMTSLLVDWPGRRKAHLEWGVDITKTARQREMLESILDAMDSYIYVTDLDTDEILFINRKMAADFGLNHGIKGEICWKHLQPGMERRCDFCPKSRLLANPDEPVRSKTHNRIVDKTFSVIDRVIDWPGGKRVHMEQAIDISEAEQARNALVQREKILDILNHVAMIFLKRSQGEFGDAIEKGIGLIAGMAHVDRLSVFRNSVHPDGLRLSQLYRWRKDVGGIMAVRANLIDTTYAAFVPRWEGILAAGECVGGIARLMPEAEALKQFGCAALLAVPVFTGGRFWGVVLFERLVEEDFTAFEIHVLRSASFLLVNAVLRNEEALALREASKRVKLMLDASPLGCILWDQSRRVVDCNGAVLRLLGIADKADLTEWFFACTPEYQPDGRRSDEKALAMVDKAFSGEALVFEWMHRAMDGTLVPVEVTLTPIEQESFFVVVGYVRDLRVVRQLEKNILQLESEVEKIYYDPLTGIHNRRFFDEKMGYLIAALSRSGSMLSLLMIDVDYFKQYNDIYGHPNGDECLKNIAEALRNGITRADDFAARYGGEEFVVVLPNTGESGARMIARRLLADVLRCNIPHEKNGDAKCVTISIGVTSGKVKHTQDVNDFVQRADAMLYESKRGGRNRYTFARFS